MFCPNLKLVAKFSQAPSNLGNQLAGSGGILRPGPPSPLGHRLSTSPWSKWHWSMCQGQGNLKDITRCIKSDVAGLLP